MRIIAALAAFVAYVPAQAELYPVNTAVRKIVDGVSEERITATIRKLESFGTRNTLSDQTDPNHGIGAARKWIESELRGYSSRLQVRVDTYRVKKQGRIRRDVELSNVVAELPGTINKDQQVVIGAHYDTVALRSWLTSGEAMIPGLQVREAPPDDPAPGADDDGSGTAAVMELARVMSQFEFDKTVVFVLFAGEEQGLIGSKLYAQDARKGKRRIEAVLNNDIIGSIESGDGHIDNTTVHVFSAGPEDHRPSLERFFAWHLHNHVGNFILFRPIYYEGGGTRYYDPEAWHFAVRMCEQAGIYYALLQNQSELPERGSDPDPAVLKSSYYLGSQEHELDGCFYYWAKQFRDPLQVWERDLGNTFRVPERALRFDLFDRNPLRSRLPHPSDPRLASDTNLRYRWSSPHAAKDMREAAGYFVENIRNVIPGGPRHSGPATLFKYFFQAGNYNYLIGEAMYGPFEVVLASLRGASLAYGQPRYGAHIASQWSTTPHDDPAAFRRYFLALATCYMQGVREIYQEDCLWHMEYDFAADDRFSPACQGHLKVHRDFYRFTRARSRRGRLRVPLGCLHGRYDGWNCFGSDMIWGQAGAEWDAGAPEKSWDLLKTFFPRSVLAAIYRQPCPHEPVGFFTGTPYGPVDIVPIEAPAKHLRNYTALVLVGWNTAEAEQVERLSEYVENGGHLTLGLVHLSTEIRRKAPPQPLAGPEVRKLLGLEIAGLRAGAGHYAGSPGEEDLARLIGEGEVQLGKVTLHEAVARVIDANGTPVVLERRLGQGSVTFVNVAAYPGDPLVAPLYEELLRRAAAEMGRRQKQSIWVEGSEDVSFAIWDWDGAASQGASTIYLLNVNWWSEGPSPGRAQLLWKASVIPLEIGQGRIHAITVAGDWGIWAADADTDVIAIEPDGRRASVRVQGQGKTELTVLYRPGASAGATRPPITGRAGDVMLRFAHQTQPGLWRTELLLDGPAQVELDFDQ